MQTFLPLPSFSMAASCLTDEHLTDSIRHARVIYKIITYKQKPGVYKHDPAVRMWFPFPRALSLYFNALLKEAERRGLRTKQKPIVCPLKAITNPCITQWCNWERPLWLFEPADLFCSHQRAALLVKNKKHYSKFQWTETPKLNYWWPDNRWHRI